MPELAAELKVRNGLRGSDAERQALRTTRDALDDEIQRLQAGFQPNPEPGAEFGCALPPGVLAQAAARRLRRPPLPPAVGAAA